MKTQFKIIYFITPHSKRVHGLECPYGCVHIYGKFILYKSGYVCGKLLTHIICSFCAYTAFINETPDHFTIDRCLYSHLTYNSLL